ncbi:DNA polymerase III subunit chi [Asaia sp. W19]|uniref:DNA polymerase III subunit chi n=1 Tax=unclassified Asaia TaxID=2685023 RepID=UPI000F8E42FB|nr:DNA polymerase III subunit chi [Asaia sp. W19]RUT26339.1 DNA polymerase III subunit chi [Asaia sp. W19]
MSAIGFYHLTRTTLEDALPPLLGRTLDSGQRAVIRCRDAAQVKQLDEALWKAKSPLWLPHGSQSMGHGPRQPIWLTKGDDVPNEARFLFLLDGGIDTALERFERIFTLFDGNDTQAVSRARSLWSSAKQAGHDLAYWQQQERGWQKAG